MPPIAASLAQSDTKVKFLSRIGLTESDKIHRHIYSLMKEEAVQRWVEMSKTRTALMAELRDDPTVEPPYSFGQIDEQVLQNEIRYIYRHARPETKPMYDLGHDSQTEDPGENWIIRWLLWHVFRYRDDRNSAASRINSAPRLSEASAGSSTAGANSRRSSSNSSSSRPLALRPVLHAPSLLPTDVREWQPCDDGQRPNFRSSPAAASPLSPTTTDNLVASNPTQPRQRYYDPVREEFRDS